MTANLQRYIAICLLLAGSLLLRPVTVEAQSVGHAAGSFCVGVENLFYFAGSGSVTWSITGNYTIISSNGTSVYVKWNAPGTATVTARYSSGSVSYPGSIFISAAVTPTCSITASTNNVCAGTSITFTAVGISGGSSPYYEWFVNGSEVSGVQGPTWTTTTLTNGQQVSCTMVSTATCTTASAANSNVITMAITPQTTLAPTIIGSTSVCGTSPIVGFSCNVSGGGTLSYQWQRNGANVSSNQGNPPAYALAYGPINNGDVFRCVVSSNGCYSPGTSNAVTVAVTSPQVVSVGIGPTTGLSYCTGQNITLSASSSQTATGYQWQQYGSNISGATGSTYTTTVTSLAQLQAIGCHVTTAGGACLTSNSGTGTAANIPFSVYSTVTPMVSITSSVGNIICSGTSETFTASIVNGGSNPQLQWLLNGSAVVGATSSTWTTTALTNGQQVSCQLTSNAPCVTAPTVTSSAITMNVTQTQQMTLTIYGNSPVCQGSAAELYAAAGNGAGNPSFQWFRNGNYVSSDGEGAANLPANELQYEEANNGDVFSCKVTTDAGCYLGATSNSLTMSTRQPTIFNEGINVSTLAYCQGSTVTLTASQPATSYQWESYGNYILGATGPTYQTTATSVADLQAISLVVPASGSCITNTQATASTAAYPFTISPWVTSSVSISASPSVPTIGSPVTFTANTVNSGYFPAYQWQINGQDVNGATSSTFTTTFTSGSEYQNISVAMTSDDFCVSNPNSSANTQYQLYLPNWEDQNYIRLHEIVVPGVSSFSDIAVLPAGSDQMTTVYFDGLERPIQRVKAAMATPDPANPGAAWGDVVTPMTYDQYNRGAQEFLPYTTTANPGAFKSTASADQPQYYLDNYNESPAYGQVTFENSPLNRVTNTKSAGSAWSASPGNSTSYDLNDQTADAVQIWTAGDDPGDNPVNLGPYGSNTLFKNTYTDEQGNVSVEFTNSTGQLVLKKVEISKSHPTPHGGWICTYHIYDDRGLLRFIIQPEGVNYLEANGWSFAGTAGQQALSGWCYRYEYDDRGRLTLKQEPGTEAKRIVYDNRDRMVFTQDGNQFDKASKEWTAILYDALDRPVLTALYETTSTAQQLQSQIPTTNTSTALSTPGATVSALNSPLAATDLNNSAVTTILKYEFYDDYTYPGAKSFRTDFDNGLAYSNGDPISPTQRTLSLPTGKLVRVMETNTFLETSTYYDEKGRAIQVQADNILGGTDATTRQYDFPGKQLSSNTKHTTANTGYTNYSVVTKNLFDQLGRITSVQKKYGANDFKTISAYDYDDLGRMKTKHFDPGYTGSGKTELESLTYSYNINNQLTGINKDYALKTAGVYNKWGNFFGLYLGYDNKDGVFAAGQLNGHIAGSLWSTQGDDVQRKYDYTYDEDGRISQAAYGEKQNVGDGWSNSSMDFTISGRNGQIQYDLNGNIQYLLHRGVLLGNTSPQNVDDLQYQYGASSNQLTNITDNGTLGTANGSLGDFQNGSNLSGNAYAYDGNGNLITDMNKNINSLGGADGTNGIHYNYLDKPEQIRIPGKGTMALVYDAEGTMLQRTFTPDGGGSATTTSYIDQFVYVGNNLDYIAFEEGRIRVMQTVSQPPGYDQLLMDGNMDLPGGNRGAYDFFIRDQLGNVRMVLTEETHTGSNTCTMEPGRAANEEPIFGQVDANGTPTATNEVANRFPVANIPGQSSGNGWSDATIQSYVSQVGTQASSTIGPNVLMKVMAGDQIAGQAIYYYQAPVTNSTGGTTLITDLLGSLASAIAGGGATSGALRSAESATTTTAQLNGSLPFSAAADPDANNASGNAPKAYLTVLFFDERFNFVSEGSMAYRVQTSGNGAAPLVIPPTRAPKNGYAYVYVSNESDEMVYFDNLQVSNVHGNILEENHYYAHGLKIAAISSGKLAVATEGEVINRLLYNDKELMDDGGLDWYDYGQRNYDPQIGRFQQVDPLTDIFPAWSPFQYAGNEPVGNVDLDGMESGGLPTPGGTFMGSGILMPGGGLGGLGGAANGLTGFEIAGVALSGANLALYGVQGGPLPPRIDFSRNHFGIIAYSEKNKLWETDGHVPADDWNHESNPTYDDERDLQNRMMQLIKDQSRDDPRVEQAAIKMVKQFFDNTGGTFEDDGLDKAVGEDENFLGFTNFLMKDYNKALAAVNGDPSKVQPFQIGNPAFNNEHNNTDGLGITIHGVSYVEVHLVKFEWTNQKAGEYRVDLMIDFYDTFGLDADDISPSFSPSTWYKFDGGLKAWYKLQHNFNHVPLLTHVNEEQAGKMNWHTAAKKTGN